MTSDRAGRATAPSDARLKRLTELSRSFTYATSLADILRYAAEQAADLLDADKAILMLADDDGLLHVHAWFGVPEDLVSRFRTSFDESLAGRLQGLFGTSEGFLGVPLVAQNRVIGLLAVLRKTGEVDDDDEWLLSALADQMAAPLENAQLASRLQQAALLVENDRLYELERQARREADAARAEAERRRLEAEEANAAKSGFLASMSHELRTPLNAIAGYVELLQMGLRGELNESQRQDLDRIRENEQLLLRLINDILLFAKLEAGRVELEVHDVPVDEALRAMEALVLPLLLVKSQHYEYAGTDRALTVRADPERLRQILLNLLGNAVKYTPAEGAIGLSARADGDVVLIEVRDTGRGIAPDRLEEIFAPFVRIAGDASTTEGTGLGLSISRDLARAMHGDVTVVSTPRLGSTFTLRLPRGR